MERYEIGKVLGEGTFGIVYAAIQKSTQRQVAVKHFKRGKFKDGVNFTALREIKLQMELKNKRKRKLESDEDDDGLNVLRLQSTHITELIDVFIQGDMVNLVFEFLPNSLDDVIKCKDIVLTTAHIKSYMRMILIGLEHCHKSYVLHRDLKPDNLLIGDNGEVKLADFGLARVFGSPNRNMTSMVCTIWYRPPELLFGAREYGAGVDIWGVGCIFAELMLRKPYLTGGNELDQLGKIFHALGTPTEENWPGMTSLPNYIEFTPCQAPPLNSIFTAAKDDALDLLSQLLKFDPLKRITATQALKHPYFTNEPAPSPLKDLPKVSSSISEDRMEITP